MPRQPRLVVPGYPHHIILRGNNRSAVFYSDKDRRFFVTCLKESKHKSGSKIYAYCMMTNHVHLIIEPSNESGLGDMMQSLGRKYVRYVNITHKRTGTLWEGRFKSSIIDKDEYLLACGKYIEMNPVRAKMVEYPADFPWSSFAYKAGGRADDIIDEDPIYTGLGKTAEDRQLNYRKYFLTNMPEYQLSMIRIATQRCAAIGSKEFLERISKTLGVEVVLRNRGRPKKSL